MSVSLKVAAGRFLKWNRKGREVATPRRGVWIRRNKETGKCVACKIGLVMIGRYGLNKATVGQVENRGLMRATMSYGPAIKCPASGCWHGHNNLGYTVERLFEKHKWSVNRIDKWLEEIAK